MWNGKHTIILTSKTKKKIFVVKIIHVKKKRNKFYDKAVSVRML